MSAPAAAARPLRRRLFASLEVREYRHFYAGLVFTLTGFWVRLATLGWWVYETSGSYSRLGVITLASMLPWVPLAPLAGVLTDRRDARGVMLWSQLGLAALNLGLGLGLWAGVVGWTEMLLAAVASGSLRAVENPARQSMARRLVGVEALPNAVGLNAAAFQATQALGYALAGGVYALAGAGACFLLVSAFTLPMVVQLARLPAAGGPARPAGRRPLEDLAEGFRYAFTHAITRAAVLGAAGVILLLLSFRTLMPGIAKDQLGLGPVGFGGLMALGASGRSGAPCGSPPGRPRAAAGSSAWAASSCWPAGRWPPWRSGARSGWSAPRCCWWASARWPSWPGATPRSSNSCPTRCAGA